MAAIVEGKPFLVFAEIVPHGKRRYCHSIRSGFKFSNYRLINKNKKRILRTLDKYSTPFERLEKFSSANTPV